MYIPLEMEFPHRLRLLHWDSYPGKCLPPTFHPDYLVELDMKYSQLEKLWLGTQSWRSNCVNLQAIPAHLSLTSLEYIFMRGFSKSKNIPVISTHIKKPELEDVPASVVLRTGLSSPRRESVGMLREITHLQKSVTEVALRYTDVKKIPYSIKALHGLTQLDLHSCRLLEELRELPGSLTFLRAEDYQSLEILVRPFDIPKAMLSFNNCFTLGERDIIPQSLFLHGSALLPGSEVPEVFDHRARGNCLTIQSTCNNPLSALSRFKVCLVVSPNDQAKENRIPKLLCRTKAKGGLRLPIEDYVYAIPRLLTEHLFIFYSDFLQEDYIEDMEVSSREIVFEFSSIFHDFDIIECGAQIWTKQSIEEEGSYESEIYESEVSEDETNIGECTYEENLEGDKHTYCCWSWLFLYFDLKNIKSLVSGRR
ncbi:unnamed protein product [Eruca vesicaria subsp. sativa]|uniref:Disease resistance protein n=1 Tax=Eruca vesicaria subsp. sativa TaxID=29727 RepID=A0ABC8L0N9_ERUVS|nr:unnamed protein product [Eruca vesicaria subsp. sativa]